MSRVCCGILSFNTTFIGNIKSCKKKNQLPISFSIKSVSKYFLYKYFVNQCLGFLLTFLIKYKENGKKMKRKKDNF